MDKYSGLASVYDHIMDHVPYDNWVHDLEEIFDKYGIKPRKILDCACGTGAMSNRLAAKGYIMTGIDLSEDMLVNAQENALEDNLRVRYLLMDMRSILLKDQFDAVISYFDGVNYLMNYEDLSAFFKSAAQVLKDDGLFIFDMSSIYKMKSVLGKNTFAESHEDMAYIWENEYDEECDELNFDMTIFFETQSGNFERHFESHHLKGHQTDDILEAAACEFTCLEVIDGDTLKQVNPNSERILFVMRKSIE